jgi:ABC-type oligopeptide transport system substrate-binding subunit
MNELQSNRTLNYYICLPSKQEKENFRFSLKIEDSDIFENQNLLNNLIGTLVKYSNSGKIEPYLAYEWQALEQGKTWVFFIRENLNDSQGTPITATAIGDQLKHRLKFLKNELGILIFNKLVGWDKFVTDPKSDEIKGIVTKNNILKFHFVEPVPNLLEFLRMVYFGYWPKQEESESIQDTSINHFISSGSYVIEPNSTHQSINLKARDNWFAIQNNSFRNIHVSTCDINNLPETPQTIIRAGTSLGLNIHNKKYIKTVTAPTMLTAAIISSEVKSKVFTDVNVRKKFSYSLRKYISESITKDSTYYFANSFYTSSNKILKYENFSTHQNSIKSKMPIKIAIPGSLNLNLFKDLENSLKKSANEVG